MTARQWPQTKFPTAPNDVFLRTQTIISASEQTREYPYYFAKHINKSIEIYLMNSGRCAMELNGRIFFFQTGDFIMIHPNTVHSFYMEKSQICTFRQIPFRRHGKPLYGGTAALPGKTDAVRTVLSYGRSHTFSGTYTLCFLCAFLYS